MSSSFAKGTRNIIDIYIKNIDNLIRKRKGTQMKDKFNIGDRVHHKIMNRNGVVIRKLSDDMIEVRHDGQIFFWTASNVENLEKVAGFDVAVNEIFFDDWDNMYGEVPDKISKCVCESRDLFNYGCRCGFFAKEKKNEVQG